VAGSCFGSWSCVPFGACLAPLWLVWGFAVGGWSVRRFSLVTGFACCCWVLTRLVGLWVFVSCWRRQWSAGLDRYRASRFARVQWFRCLCGQVLEVDLRSCFLSEVVAMLDVGGPWPFILLFFLCVAVVGDGFGWVGRSWGGTPRTVVLGGPSVFRTVDRFIFPSLSVAWRHGIGMRCKRTEEDVRRG
jgi:hypothetical protein